MLKNSARKKIQKKVDTLNTINFVCFIIAIFIMGIVCGLCETYPLVCIFAIIPMIIILAIIVTNEPKINAMDNILAIDYLERKSRNSK